MWTKKSPPFYFLLFLYTFFTYILLCTHSLLYFILGNSLILKSLILWILHYCAPIIYSASFLPTPAILLFLHFLFHTLHQFLFFAYKLRVSFLFSSLLHIFKLFSSTFPIFFLHLPPRSTPSLSLNISLFVCLHQILHPLSCLLHFTTYFFILYSHTVSFFCHSFSIFFIIHTHIPASSLPFTSNGYEVHLHVSSSEDDVLSEKFVSSC